MNLFDIILVVFWIIALIEGIRKGFIRQAFGLIALFAGCYGAFRFSQITGQYLGEWFQMSPKIQNIVAFAITFIVILLLVYLIGRLAEKIVSIVQLGFVNRILGVVFALAKWTFIMIVALFIFNKLAEFFGADSIKTLKESYFYPFLDKLSNIVFPYLQKIGQ